MGADTGDHLPPRASGPEDDAATGPCGETASDAGVDSDYVVIVVYVPQTHAGEVREALGAAGAGAIGDYRQCSWTASGIGRFTPVDGAQPAIGSVGVPEEVAEERIEVIAPLVLARRIVDAVIAAHPYEEPAHHVIPVLNPRALP